MVHSKNLRRNCVEAKIATGHCKGSDVFSLFSRNTCFSFAWESVADCIYMGLLFYSFGLLPCVRVHGRLYPHGLTVLLFWFSLLCESLLRSVCTWAYCFTLLVFSLVWESVVDCMHMGLLFYSSGLLPCVVLCCGLYPHGLTVLILLFAPLCESLLRTVSAWAYWFTLLVFSLVWESVASCIHMGLLFYCFGLLPCVRVRCGLYPYALTVLLSSFSHLCESPLVLLFTLPFYISCSYSKFWQVPKQT